MHYFDYNATAPMMPAARDAWAQAMDAHWFNPSSPYLPASSVGVRLDASREQLAQALGCSPSCILFNSGATEGNNAALHHLGRTCPPGKRMLVGALEHPSVREPAKQLPADRVEWVGVDADGVVDAALIKEHLAVGNVHAVSLMAANNETGVLQPWQEVLDACHAAGALYHCDAVQWFGKLPCQGLGQVDFLTGCAHKFGGPKGCGFLKIPDGSSELGFLLGGAQEGGRRAGTQNYPAVAAMMEALRSTISADSFPRDSFERELTSRIRGAEVVGGNVDRLWNTSLLLLPDFPNTRWVNRLARQGFLVSTGSACATAKDGPSHVLAAMGVASARAARAVRVSSGPLSDVSDWLALADAFVEVHAALRSDNQDSASVSIPE